MYKVNFKDDSFPVNIEGEEIKIEGLSDLEIQKIDDYSYLARHQNQQFQLHVVNHDRGNKSLTLKLNGKKTVITIKDKYDLLLEKLGLDQKMGSAINNIKAPMPGMIVQITVDKGQAVKKGDKLLVLEAMKMENVIKAPADGVVENILVKQGESVEKNHVMIEF